MNNLKKCVLCLTINRKVFQVDDEHVCESTVHNILLKLFKSQFDFEFELRPTSKICVSCLNNVKKFYKFYTEIEQIHLRINQIPTEGPDKEDKSLTFFAKEGNDLSTTIPLFSTSIFIKDEISSIENEQNNSYDDVKDTTMVQPDNTIKETTIVKIIDFNEMIDCNNINNDNDNEHNDNKNYNIDVLDINITPEQNDFILDGNKTEDTLKLQKPVSKIRKRKRSPSNSSSCSSSNCSSSNNSRSSSKTPKETIRNVKRSEKSHAKQHKSSYQEDNTKISKYVKMQCTLCDHKFQVFSDAKQHYRTCHDRNGFVTCCDKKFFKLYRALQHCIWHENPLAFTCSVCNKSFMDSVYLKEHQKSHIAGKRSRQSDESQPKQHKLSYLEDNAKICKYIKMQCTLCDAKFEIFSDAKYHYRTFHNRNGFLTCCDKKFFKLSRAVQHYTWHENPLAFTCSICNKSFMDSVYLKEHQNVHIPQKERPYKCDLCDRTFLRPYMLTSHKKLQHAKIEDKKFACDICGLKFIAKGFLRSHIKRVHENSDSRICDICARFFKCAKAYEHHYLVEHTTTLERVKCELCGKWLKHALSLKDHLKLHRATTEQCEQCGKICRNKKTKRTHIRTVHNGYSIEYPCAVCNKPFKKQQTLKEHMTQHTGEKNLYKCTFCTRTFRSSANMYAHRKRQHPKEYEENKLLGNKYPL